MGHGAGRVRSGISLALSGSLTLLAALLLHEWLSFGPGGHDVIAPASAPCPEVPCITTGIVVTAQIAKAIGAAAGFALIGAIWVDDRWRWTIAGPVWVAEYLWSLVGVASGHRAGFGTGWSWWEPFATLMWSPTITPALGLAGVALCWGLDRWGRRARG